MLQTNIFDIIKKFFSYYIFTLVSIFVGLFSISFLTNVITPEEFGYIGFYNTLIFFLPALISFSGGGLLSIELINSNELKYKKIRNNFIVLLFINSIILVISIFIFKSFFQHYFFIVFFSIIMSTLLTLTSIHNTELINFSKSRQFGYLGSINQLLILLLSFFFLKYLGLSWEFRLYSFLISELIILYPRFFILSTIIKDFTFSIDKEILKQIYVYGLPLIFYILISSLLHQSDRFFLLNFFSMKELGYYTVAAGLSSIISMINSNFDKVLLPIIYNNLKNGTNYKLIDRISMYYGIMILTLAFFYSIILYYFGPFFLSSKYVKSIEIACIMNFSQAFLGVYSNRGMVVDYYKKNIEKTIIYAFCVLISLISVYLLIPFFGYYAPSLSMLIGFILLSIIVRIYSSKLMFDNKK